MPAAADPRRLPISPGDGDIGDFCVCDYIEDAIEMKVTPGPDSSGASGGESRGYFELRCAAVTVHHNQPCG